MPRYSQNFLINESIVDFILDAAELRDDDVVLEIGPGKGILTEKLLKRVSVCAIEIDETLCQFLKLKFSEEIQEGKLRLVCGDALKIDYPYFTKVVANIPYHISSPLLFKILSYDFHSGIIMVQYEFAERLCACPGSKKYGRLSVMMYYYGIAKILRKVKKGNFRPIPRVDSAIVKIIKMDRFCEDRNILDFVVRKIFEQRRKKIKNVLGPVPYGEYRAEKLTPEQICEIATHIKSKQYSSNGLKINKV